MFSRLTIITALTILGSAATAQDKGNAVRLIYPGDIGNSTTSPALVLEINDPRAFFRLGPGGCLRGPLQIETQSGGAFALEAGAEYPMGCGTAK